VKILAARKGNFHGNKGPRPNKEMDDSSLAVVVLPTSKGNSWPDEKRHIPCRYVLCLILEDRAMIEVLEMAKREIDEVLARVGYGHLACAQNDRPYVVPIHYVYDKLKIYIYTTEGKKTDILDANPKVCLQVEEVVDNDEWKSVIVHGEAERVTDRKEREKAVKLVRSINPTLTPAISIRWMDQWIRENREVVYRIEPHSMTGRSTLKVKISAAFARPGAKQRSQIF
jgi:nitroimidazol reductase NimA-like FMN-containing flavoprotein (pyridoxamine 5'-phosphate oxidase superfamily)